MSLVMSAGPSLSVRAAILLVSPPLPWPPFALPAAFVPAAISLPRLRWLAVRRFDAGRGLADPQQVGHLRGPYRRAGPWPLAARAL